MRGNLSPVDVMGIIGFIWSFVSFYVGYLWYKEGANKDTLIAKLTAENELLRREVQAVSSADGGRKQHELVLQRSINRRGLDKLNEFYRAAFSFARSHEDGGRIYIGMCLAIAVAIVIAIAYHDETFIPWSLAMPFILALIMIELFPFSFLIDGAVIRNRLGRLQALLDREGFSFHDALLVKNWLDHKNGIIANLEIA